MSSTGSNRHTTSQSRRRPSTYTRSSELGSGDPRTSCGCRWNTGNQSSATWILERSHRLHRSRKWARKMGRTTRLVRQTRNTGRRAQTKACARQESMTQRVLHPETRRAAREQVGAETTGRTTRRVLQPQKTGRRAQPQACARQESTTQMRASPSNPTRRTRESGHFKERGAQPDGCVNTGTRGGAQPKTCARQGSTMFRVLHPETRHAGALRERGPGAFVTSGTDRRARRTAVAVCRRPREEDAFEQDRPSTYAQTGMSGVSARLGLSGSLVRS